MGILMEKSEVNLRSGGYKPEVFTMTAPGEYYSAINTRETEYQSVVEPIPITFKTYNPYQVNGHQINYFQPQQVINNFNTSSKVPIALESIIPSSSTCVPNQSSPVKVEEKTSKPTQAPPKKKWIREYLEEPKLPVVQMPVALVMAGPRPVGSPPAAPPVFEPAPAFDFTQETSRLKTTSNSHGCQIPSPPLGSNSSGSLPRSGTREVHNKLEKNRRAHLKECFEILKRQLPTTPDDKKISNLSVLHSAIRYIQMLRRRERDCEHELERLARAKIAAQQQLAAVRREVTTLAANNTTTIRSIDPTPLSSEEKPKEDRVNGQVLGIPISMSPAAGATLRPRPVHIAPTTAQVVRTSYGARHNTLTLTTIAPADHKTTLQNGQCENGMNALSTTTLVHPAHLHLPLSQVVSSGGLVVGGALQLLSAPAALRVLNGVATSENNRISRENGLVSSQPSSDGASVVTSLTPLVVTPPSLRLHSHTITTKMVDSQMVKSAVTPLTVSAQYLSATTLVKPVVVVSTSATPPSTSA